MDTSLSNLTGRRRRRKHSAEFKARLVQACEQPGVSSAAIAMASGVNANLLRRWVNDAGLRGPSVPVPLSTTGSAPKPAPEFIPLQLPVAKPKADIRIELQRGSVSVSVIWPVSATAECATWMREVLR